MKSQRNEADRLRAILAALEDNEVKCANYVRPYTCWGNGRSLRAFEGADKVCAHCVASRAMRDLTWWPD